MESQSILADAQRLALKQPFQMWPFCLVRWSVIDLFARRSGCGRGRGASPENPRENPEALPIRVLSALVRGGGRAGGRIGGDGTTKRIP